ncbi:TetR/AcrR family transcriptional regulator [Neobacillus drentensis]|uniref:TetR/AcrR family transcriptional regulator n=1 Tax=Neobacillus drentensis TaxID=220684 RepID=UPI0008261DEC|nr:TetR/AcrR family transcriptional regulator [Neobacillus drentensis]
MTKELFDSNTKGKIVDTAIDLFYKNGYHATGMREIAKHLGITVSNLYNYFTGKSELLFFIMEHVMRKLIDGVQMEIESREDPLAQLRSAIHFHIFFHGNHQKAAWVTDNELRGLEGEMFQHILGLRDQYESIYVKILENAISNDQIEPLNTKLIAYAILNMCTGVTYWYRADRPLTLQNITDKYFLLLINGLGLRNKENC